MSFEKNSAFHLFVYGAAILLMVFIFFSNPAAAQVAGGTISGTITDPSGAGVPQASIAIKNVATGVERTVVTNSDGFYTAPNLLPGEYEITVIAKGFNKVVKAGMVMNVGAQRTFDTTMQIGTVGNTVQVTTDAPDVELASSDIGATVNATTVRELPLNGRSWTDLAALQPGVDTIETQPSFATGSDRGNRGFGQQLTISGARPQQNNYRLDGVSLNDYANGAPGSVLGGNLGVDAIQEFSVLTSNYSAEYGKTSGGVVNATTRSGTNSFHGGAYEFIRNDKLDAANFFENAGGIPRAPFKRNQFGGDVGGPIYKDKTFFFIDYEGIRQAKSIPNVNFVPSAQARLGNIHDSNGNPLTVTVDPNVQKYLPLYPLPNGPLRANGDVGLYTFSGNQVVNENFVTTRIDHKFSEKDSLFGTYMLDNTPYFSPDSMGNVQLNTLSHRQIFAIEETHTFSPSVVNALRFGYNHERVDNNASASAINPLASDASLGAFSGRDAAVVIVPGVLSQMNGGVGGLPTYYYRWNSFQGYDDAFWTKGTHSIKFGAAYEHMLLNVTALTDPNGIWYFSNMQNFLTNAPSKFQGGIASSLTPRHLSQDLIGGYIQDDWRFKPTLTLNLGMRYEMTTVPTEANNKLANLPTLSSQNPHIGNPFFNNPTTTNFEPRIGFAWDPLHNGRMAVRGGGGLFDVLPLPYQFILLTTQSAPFFQYTNISKANTPGLSFYNVPSSQISPNTLRSTYVEPNPERNYVIQFNLNIQYQFTPSLAGMVAYVGSRGIHQPFRVDEANIEQPILTSAGYLWPQVDQFGNLTSGPNAGSAPTPINPFYNSVRGMFYDGRSYYNALETQLAKRMSHGFQVQGTFTWSKSIDTSSATLAGDAFGNSISSLDYFNTALTRGLSDFNVGRTVVINGTWDLPGKKDLTGAPKWVTNGWELGLIFTASDGVPFTPTWGTGSDPATTLSSDDYAYPNRLGGPGCATLTNPGNPNNYIKTQCFAIPTAPSLAFWQANCDQYPPSLQNGGAPVAVKYPTCFNLRGNAGRNIMIGPGVTDVDFSLFKNNYIPRISENFNVQFRMEIFNLFNHPNFAPPGPGAGNTDIFDGTGASLAPSTGGTAGVLQSTTIPERQIQFAVKIIF